MNKKQLIIVFLLMVTLAFPALARTIEVKPKDVPNCENFTPRELKIIQKDVDETININD